jgi:hypothetical protein
MPLVLPASVILINIRPPTCATSRSRATRFECKAYKSGWWYATAWWDQVCAACGDNVPILVYKFNNKAIRVCLPLYAINPNLPRDNSRTAVITLDEWFVLLKEYFDAQQEAA